MIRGRRAQRMGSVMLAYMVFLASPALAGGLVGDFFNAVVPGAGTPLDDIHREVKNAVPIYKDIENGLSKSVNEAIVQAGAPVLESMIAASRQQAINDGTRPIPDSVRSNLSGFIPDNILAKTRYRISGGGDLSLQHNSFKYGDAIAIALVDVIVFKSEHDAHYNMPLWAHELTHVIQFSQWGLHDFAVRYVRNYAAVEKEAYDQQTHYAAWVAKNNLDQWNGASTSPFPRTINRPISPFTGRGQSNVCATLDGVMPINAFALVGTPCWIATPRGAAIGGIIPAESGDSSDTLPMPPAQPLGFPSGTPMQQCNCWGPNPAPIAPEPRCMSQQVQVAVCPGFCAPGHPLYGYVCR